MSKIYQSEQFKYVLFKSYVNIPQLAVKNLMYMLINYLQTLWKYRSDLSRLGLDLRFYISNELPGDAKTASLNTVLRGARQYFSSSQTIFMKEQVKKNTFQTNVL